jgi:hypothetical protein
VIQDLSLLPLLPFREMERNSPDSTTPPHLCPRPEEITIRIVVVATFDYGANA